MLGALARLSIETLYETFKAAGKILLRRVFLVGFNFCCYAFCDVYEYTEYDPGRHLTSYTRER